MPYSSTADAPPAVKKAWENKGYNQRQKRAWVKIFNKALKQYGDEGRAFAVAHAAADKVAKTAPKEEGNNHTGETFREWLQKRMGE